MPNPLVIRFVSNLCAAFSRWRITDDTKSLYVRRLSDWDLTDEQWSRASSRIISERTDADLPTIAVIEQYLQAQRTVEAGQASDGGWLLWELNDKPHGMRIRNKDGKWVWAEMSVKDRNGEVIQLQKHVGDLAIPPKAAKKVIIRPDVQVSESYQSQIPIGDVNQDTIEAEEVPF